MIPIYKPFITEESLFFGRDAINSTWWANGEYKERAAKTLLECIGANNHQCLLTSNGTTALHLAVLAVKKFYPNVRKVIAPSSCYVAAWNCLLFDDPNYFTIQFLDSNPLTWNADYDTLKLENQGEGYLFLIVHNLGNPVNVPRLREKWPRAIFLEDACEAIFAKYNCDQKHVGTLAEISVFSFFGNKNITCGEGGAVVTQKLEIHKYINQLHGQGQGDQRYIHPILGYNYRMTNIQAALLQGQLVNWGEIYSKKSKLWSYYHNEIDLEFQKVEDGYHSMWMYGIRCKSKFHRQLMENYLTKNNIEFRPMFYPFWRHQHLSKYLQRSETLYQNTVNLSQECLIIPSYPSLIDEPENLNHIVKSINNCPNVS